MKYTLIFLLLSFTLQAQVKFDQNGNVRLEEEVIEPTESHFDTLAKVIGMISNLEASIAHYTTSIQETERKLRVLRQYANGIGYDIQKELDKAHFKDVSGIRTYRNNGDVSVKATFRPSGIIRMDEILAPTMEVSGREEEIFGANPDSVIDVQVVYDTTYVQNLRSLGRLKMKGPSSFEFDGKVFLRVNNRDRVFWINEEDKGERFK